MRAPVIRDVTRSAHRLKIPCGIVLEVVIFVRDFKLADPTHVSAHRITIAKWNALEGAASLVISTAFAFTFALTARALEDILTQGFPAAAKSAARSALHGWIS